MDYHGRQIRGRVGSVTVGDTMRISVELIKQLAEESDRTPLVRVVDVIWEADESKTLVLKRVEPLDVF